MKNIRLALLAAAAFVAGTALAQTFGTAQRMYPHAAPSLDAHPIRHFLAQRLRVTLNTDNRLMSEITLSEEFRRLCEVASLTLADVEKLTINAMKSAFVGYDERLAIIYQRIKPGFAKLRGEPALAGYRLPPTA